MRAVPLFLLGILLLPYSVQADERCGPGRVFDRGIIGCIQEFCPPTTGRNYDGICQCSNSEWGGEPRTDCRNPAGLLTHCVPKDQVCTAPKGAFDPVTGITSFATLAPSAPEAESPYAIIRFFQRLYRGSRDSQEERDRPRGFVILGVMGKFMDKVRGR